MLSEEMQKALNGQLNREMYSAYLYLSMSAYFQSLNLGGSANWMRVQAQEEMVHAMKFYDFINERAGRVTLLPLEAPPLEWDSSLSAFQEAYEHEQNVTGLINDLMELALSEHDHATQIFLQWFVTEQLEEEDSANEVVQKIKLVGDAQGGLFMIDQELGQRVFTPPAPAAEG